MRIKSRNKAKKKPFVIAMVGAVGSGKTYTAKRLAKTLGAAHIQTDAIRVSLRKQGRAFSRAPALAKARAKRLLSEGRSVIFDSDFINSKKTAQPFALAKTTSQPGLLCSAEDAGADHSCALKPKTLYCRRFIPKCGSGHSGLPFQKKVSRVPWAFHAEFHD